MDQNDLDAMLNTVYVPEDAGEHADALRRILERIPERWGRWISCASGWYPLVIELDQKLAAMFPDYELHQVKEKFGTLRYYIGLPELQPQCCIDLEATRPSEGAIDPRWLRGQERTLHEQYELDKWFYEIYIPHFDTEEHEQQNAALEPERERRSKISKMMHEIIDNYEAKSAVTCELCGSPAEMRVRHYWYRTLCTPCAELDGYLPISDKEDEEL